MIKIIKSCLIFVLTAIITSIEGANAESINIMKELGLERKRRTIQTLSLIPGSNGEFRDTEHVVKTIRQNFMAKTGKLECATNAVEELKKCEDEIKRKDEDDREETKCTFSQEDFNCLYIGMEGCKQLIASLGNVTQFVERFMAREGCPPLLIPGKNNGLQNKGENHSQFALSGGIAFLLISFSLCYYGQNCFIF